MKKYLITMLPLLAVVGCTTMADMRPALDKFKGKPISVAIDRLGFPDAQQEIAGKKVYIWSTSQHSSMTLPTTSTATTYVGTTPVTTTIYGTQTQDIDAVCKIRIIASQKDIIEQWDGEGNEFGCAAYERRLVPKKG